MTTEEGAGYPNLVRLLFTIAHFNSNFNPRSTPMTPKHPNIRISRILKSSFAVALIATLTFGSTVAYAQSYFDFFASFVKGRAASRAVVATDDTDVMFIIKYTGTSERGTVTVAANGDITLKHGVTSSEAVDTTVECDASIAATGSRSGIIDVSDAACDTVGEVMNIINSQTTNWVIVPLDALLTDSTNDTLNALAETSASVNDGLNLTWDTSVAFKHTLALLPAEARKIQFYVENPIGTRMQLKKNPYAGLRTIVGHINATSTYGSGTSALTVYQMVPNFVRTSIGGSGSSTAVNTTLYGGIAGGATTVNKIFIALSDNYRIVGDDGAKVISRLENSAAMSAVTHYVSGSVYNTRVNP